MRKRIQKNSFVLLLLLAHLFFLNVEAQDRIVSGVVRSADDSSGLPGVNVIVKGTTNGTVTDFDGNYSINVADSNSVLVFSYLGFTAQEVPINNRTSIDITLTEDATSLDEVVIIGYGTQIKREVTGAVQTIKAEEFADIPVSQITQKLQGRLAGVQINQTTGIPGQGMSVRIRGQLSVSGGSDPLYVVDGFPINGDISSINPDEIQDISILKDAASTSLYGSRAANGVVLITTQRGTPNETRVTFSNSTGMQSVPQRGRVEMMNAVEFAQFKKEFFEDQGSPVPEIFQDPSRFEGQTNDWYDALLRVAPMHNYSLTVVSNNEKSRTAAVAGFFKQDGVVVNSDYERFSLRLNADYNISDKVTLGFNLAPSYIVDNIPRTDGTRGVGILFNALHTWPIMPIFDENGELTFSNSLPAETGNIFTYANWVRSANLIQNETKDFNLLANAYVSY